MPKERTPPVGGFLYVERWAIKAGRRYKVGSWRLSIAASSGLRNGSLQQDSDLVLGNPVGSGSLPAKMLNNMPKDLFAQDVDFEWRLADDMGSPFNPPSSDGISPARAAAEAAFRK